MMETLTGRELFALVPYWDGQWLSTLLRAAELPRHTLRLRDTNQVQHEVALAILEHGSVPIGACRDRLGGIPEHACQATKSFMNIGSDGDTHHTKLDDTIPEWQVFL